MFIRAGETQVFSQDLGSGPPILFLHGNPDTSDVWEGVIEGLHRHYHCLAPDLPGFGRSSAAGDFDCSFESLGSFIDRLVEAIGVDLPLNLVAHDFGGAFGMAWAIQHPEKVRRMVVINHPFFVAGYRWHIWARLWRTPVLGELQMLALTWPAFYRIVRYGSRQLPRETIRRMYSFLTPQWRHVALRLYRAAGPEAFRSWEPRMLQLTERLPTLVMWGAQDPWVPAWVANCFGAQKVIHFPESGHWTPAEVPDRVGVEIRNFVESA